MTNTGRRWDLLGRGSALVVVLLFALTACSASAAWSPTYGPSEAARQIEDRGSQALPFLSGVVSNAGARDSVRQVQALGAPLVRVEVPIQTPADAVRPLVDAYAKAGVRLLLLAGFTGQVPSESAAGGLGGWASEFGPSSGRPSPIVGIEIGNETSYASQYDDGPSDASFVQRASDYARLAAASGKAIRAADAKVPVLVQADDGNTNSPVWVDSMFRSVPDLATVVDGWTIHPYGPTYAQRIARARQQLERHDAFKPLWITEWGLASDDGRCLSKNYGWNRCMTADEAASTLLKVVDGLRPEDIGAFFVYQVRDQRAHGSGTDSEYFFGILTADGKDKGSYTSAVRSLWAAR